MTYSDDGLTNSKMEWSFLISVLMMVILTNSDSDFVEGRVDGVKGRVDGVEGRVDGVEGRVDGVERRVDGVEGRVDDNPLATNSCLLWRWLNEPT